MACGIWICEHKCDADVRFECSAWGDWRDLELSRQLESKAFLIIKIMNLGIGMVSGVGGWNSVAKINRNVRLTVDNSGVEFGVKSWGEDCIGADRSQDFAGPKDTLKEVTKHVKRHQSCVNG